MINEIFRERNGKTMVCMTAENSFVDLACLAASKKTSSLACVRRVPRTQRITYYSNFGNLNAMAHACRAMCACVVAFYRLFWIIFNDKHMLTGAISSYRSIFIYLLFATHSSHPSHCLLLLCADATMRLNGSKYRMQ